MPIVHVNGFGTLPVSGDFLTTAGYAGSTFSRQPGRYGGYALRHSSTGGAEYGAARVPIAAWTEFSLGVAINHRATNASPGGNHNHFGFTTRLQSNTLGWYVALGTASVNYYAIPTSVTAWTVVDSSPTGVGWHWWSWVFKAAATGGICRLYRDGALIAQADGDTLTTTGSGVFQDLSVYIGNASSSYLADLGDFILRNDTTVIPDSVVTSLFPIGTTAAAWVGSDGNSTDNHALINENPAYSAATYVGTATVGAVDTYTLGDLPNSAGTVHAVQVGARAFKSDAGAKTLRTRINAQNGNALDPGGAATVYQLATTSDGSTAWTTATINAATASVEVVT